MAFVVARPKGRFEIRESVHTPQGPRARSLANFKELDEEVLARARRRATRPFDTNAVRAAAAARAAAARSAPSPIPRHQLPATQQFVEASRRMAAALGPQARPADSTRDPGDAFIDLLGLVAQVGSFRPPRDPEPLRFPPLARLHAAHRAGSSG
jgi:hypothetical protein